MAMVQLNINSVQSCHESFMQSLESRLITYEHESKLHRLATLGKRDMEIETQIAMLKLVMEFDHLNAEGFRKILIKFEKQTGFAVSEEMMAILHGQEFIKDLNFNGRCAKAMARLCKLRSPPLGGLFNVLKFIDMHDTHQNRVLPLVN